MFSFIKEYAMYCYDWYKRNGLKRQVLNPFYRINGMYYVKFITPVKFYKEKQEALRWINAAKRKKAAGTWFNPAHCSPFENPQLRKINKLKGINQ